MMYIVFYGFDGKPRKITFLLILLIHSNKRFTNDAIQFFPESVYTVITRVSPTKRADDQGGNHRWQSWLQLTRSSQLRLFRNFALRLPSKGGRATRRRRTSRWLLNYGRSTAESTIGSTWKPLFSPPPAARRAWDEEVNCAIATGADLWIIINRLCYCVDRRNYNVVVIFHSSSDNHAQRTRNELIGGRKWSVIPSFFFLFIETQKYHVISQIEILLPKKKLTNPLDKGSENEWTRKVVIVMVPRRKKNAIQNLPRVERWNRPRNRDTLRIAFVVPRDIRCDHLSRGRSAR